MNWSLRYASHLGYLSHEAPLFKESVGSLDVTAHVNFAAELGLSGVLYPWATSRPHAERNAVAAAIERHSMEAGCVVYAPKEVVLQPLWVQPSFDARAKILQHLSQSIPLARSLNSGTLAVLVKSDEHRPRQTQLDALTANLQFAADVVRNFGLTIGLEPMIALPGMLFRNCAEAGELLGRLADPALKLIFDTGHAYDMGDDIVPSFDAFFDHVGLVQFADQPGRLEPGSGRIDFESLLTIAHRRGYRGLIELEHAWSKPGVQGEAEGIERLRALDQKACETAARGAG